MLDVDKHRNERYGFPQTKKEEKHMFLHEIYSSTVTVQPTRLTTASNIGYILAGAVPVGSAIRLH